MIEGSPTYVLHSEVKLRKKKCNLAACFVSKTKFNYYKNKKKHLKKKNVALDFELIVQPLVQFLPNFLLFTI